MIALYQLDGGRAWNEAATLQGLYGSFLMYYPGVYMIDFDGDYSTETGDASFHDGLSLGMGVTKIGSIVLDGITPLTEVFTFNDLYTEPSFYNDVANRRCYFRLPGYSSADLYALSIGITQYISTHAVYDNGTPYMPSIQTTGVQSIIDARDSLISGKFEYEPYSLSINTGDDYNISSETLNFINQQTRVYAAEVESCGGCDEVISKTQVYTGYVESYGERYNQIGVSLQDDRKRFSAPVLENQLSLGDYPNMKDTLDGVYKPLRLGRCEQVEALCLNGDEYTTAQSGTYTFIVADPAFGAIRAITNARVNDEPITIASTDLNACTFTVTKGAGVTIETSNVTVDVTGPTGYDNGADIIRWLLVNRQEIQYTALRYDTTAWEAAKLVMYNSFLNVEEQSIVVDEVEKIAISNQVLFKTDATGRITLITEDLNATPVANITKESIINSTAMQIDYTNDEVYSQVNVTYNGGKIVTAKNGDTLLLYGVLRPLDVEYNIAETVDAQAIADKLIDLVSTRRGVTSIVIPDYFGSIKANDIVQVDLDRPESTWKGTRKMLVMRSERDLLNNTYILFGYVL